MTLRRRPMGPLSQALAKLLDRMIAAQALVHRASLVTFNPDDFSDIPGLSSLVWPSK